MESLRKQGPSTSRRNKNSVRNFHRMDGIISSGSSIKNMKKWEGGKNIIGDILFKYLDLEINSPTKVSEIINTIQKSDDNIKILRVGDIPYPDGMTSDITEIVKDNSFRSRVFSNVLSEGELTEGEFSELIEKMKEVREVTDMSMDVCTSPEGRILYITLWETKPIGKGPFMDKTPVIKISIPFEPTY